MNALTNLLKLVKELEDDLSGCMRCGMCQAVCPLYRETKRETDVARGKLALIEGLQQNLFEKPEVVQKRIDKCLLCGSCMANCPSGVKSVEIFIKARMLLSQYKTLSSLKRTFLRMIVTDPVRFNMVLNILSRMQSLFLTPPIEPLNTSCARFLGFFVTPRHLTPLSEQPFHKIIHTKPLFSPENKKGRIAFFTGCLVDRLFPSIGMSAIDILKKTDFNLYIPENQGCCGMPSLSAGDFMSFQKIVVHNVKIFDEEKFDILVTACATCTFTIKKLWPSMFKIGERSLLAKARRLAEKTIDISELLRPANFREKAGSSYTGRKMLVTYHDPCHLRKSLGIWKEPREVLGSLKGYDYVEMAEAESCCGFGGSFGFDHPKLSFQIGAKKFSNIIASGAEIVVTSCPACIFQLRDIISRAGKKIAVKHLVEVVASDCAR